MATGLSRLTMTAALSPGMTISIPSGRTHFAGDVRGPEEELRLVAAEERRVPSAFVLAQDVNLTLELQPGPDRSGSGNHLAPPDLVALDASQQQADVLASFALVQRFVERLDAGADTFENVAQAEDFDLLAHGDDALLDLAGRHRAPALDGVNALDGHEERLVDGPLRLRDVACPERRAGHRCSG